MLIRQKKQDIESQKTAKKEEDKTEIEDDGGEPGFLALLRNKREKEQEQYRREEEVAQTETTHSLGYGMLLKTHRITIKGG